MESLLPKSDRKPILLNIAFIVVLPALVLPAAALYVWNHGVAWTEIATFVGLWIITGIGITGGYHRLFAHRGYKAAWPVRAFYAVAGAMAGQNSVIAWASDHRYHHQCVDTDGDPYNAREGFYWSHMGWILRQGARGDVYDNVPDLRGDPILAFQHKHWLLVATLGNLAVLLPVGMLSGRLFGTLLLAGLVRLIVVQHTTFLINSAAHMWGRQPWSTQNSARDNWFLSFFTFGEGYHNYHHAFQADYRNGVRWYHWDPAKWLIFVLSKVGLASELRRMPEHIILKARVDEGRRSFREAAGPLTTANPDPISGVLRQAAGDLRDRGAAFREGLREGQNALAARREAMLFALRGQIGEAEGRVDALLTELKDRGQEWARLKRELWEARSREVREALAVEIAELEFRIAEARRGARRTQKRWERLAARYIAEMAVPVPQTA